MESQFAIEGVSFRGREAPPSHYLFQIQSFSELSKASINEYHSDKFEAGGYKWKLVIYPTGYKSSNKQDRISIYLELADTSSFSTGWEVNVVFNLFVFNKLQDKYFSFQDGHVRRFHAMKTKWGINNFIELATFSNPLNGYLIDDTCVFGAEVFVVKSGFKGECLKMISQPVASGYTWKVDHFSKLFDQCYKSDPFVLGDYKWKILLYPYGVSGGRGTHMSLFLAVEETTCPSDTKLFVKFSLCIKDQFKDNHAIFKADRLFSPAAPQWGLNKFLSLTKMKDLSNGLLLDDICTIEAQVEVLGKVEPVDSAP